MQIGPAAGGFSERQQIWVLAYHAPFPKSKRAGQDTSRTQHEHTLSAGSSWDGMGVWKRIWAGVWLPLIGPSLGVRRQPTLWLRGELITAHPPERRKRVAWMTQSLKWTPLSTSSGLPWVAGLSLGGPGPDISLLKAFLGGMGAFVSPFLLWHLSLLLRQSLRKLPATACNFLPNCFPFPP